MTKVTIDKALLEQAIAALGLALSDVDWRQGSPTQPVIHKTYNKLERALRAALSEPAVEPYGYMSHDEHTFSLARDVSVMQNWSDYFTIPLYKAPPAEYSCKWPTCQTEKYQQDLADQLARELIGTPTTAPLLTDEEVGMLTVFDGLHHVETPLLADFIRQVEASVRQKAGLK